MACRARRGRECDSHDPRESRIVGRQVMLPSKSRKPTASS
jgi:hypothetical protein